MIEPIGDNPGVPRASSTRTTGFGSAESVDVAGGMELRQLAIRRIRPRRIPATRRRLRDVGPCESG
jgi:hypothetical protein